MRILALLFLFVMAPTLVFADPREDAYAAFKRKDYDTALKIWRPLADQGDPDVQSNLGALYSCKKCGTQNFAEAAKWYRMAADRGEWVSQWELGQMYRKG